jgi:hypothetical protein
MSDAPPETPSPQPQPQPRPKLFPSRIIVFSLLAIALVALGFDVTARLKQRQAYGMLQAYVDEEQIDPAAETMNMEPPTPPRVQELLGRAPATQSGSKEDLQQTYSWQGVFNRYHLIAHYGGATLAAEDPKDAQPLLLRVQQTSNYIWESPSEPAVQ